MFESSAVTLLHAPFLQNVSKKINIVLTPNPLHFLYLLFHIIRNILIKHNVVFKDV